VKSIPGSLHKSLNECPKCHHKGCAAIYKNPDKSNPGKHFYLLYCFSTGCGAKYPVNEEGEEMEKEESEVKVTGLIEGEGYADLLNKDDPWGYRGIVAQTCKVFGVQLGHHHGRPVLIFPNYNEKGELHAQKLRGSNPFGKREFTWLKGNDQVNTNKTFFGQNLWRPEKHQKIAVVFGEFDALALYQMLPGFAVISVPDGDDSAAKYVERYYNWLRRFREIIFVPDNDGKCSQVAEALAARFPRQAKLAVLTKHKDPCDYLANGDTNLFREEFVSAQPFTPQKIVGLSSFRRELLEDPPVPIADYPWEGLNRLTGGIWAGELVTIKAPPKVGKSSLLNAVAYHLYRTTDKKIGLIYLEETKRDLVFRLVSMHLEKNLQRPEIRQEVERDELLSAFHDLTSNERFFVVEHWGACSSDFLEEKITELVLATGCQFIFFDHVSMAITDESNKDERVALDRLVSAIKALTVGIKDIDEEGNSIIREPTIFMVTHVNDNGQPRGSRIAVQISNLVIGLQRNKLAETPEERNVLTVVVEDNRRYGETGVASKLFYDWRTTSLTEIPTEKKHES